MRRHTLFMKLGRFQLALMMALAAIVTPCPRFAHAVSGAGVQPVSRATEATWEGSTPGDDAGIQRWWGAVGAVLCGAELRLIRVAPAIGMNPYVLAAGIGGCLLAAMDIMTTT